MELSNYSTSPFHDLSCIGDDTASLKSNTPLPSETQHKEKPIMAFVNEYIPAEDVKKYGIEEINKKIIMDFNSSRQWTIDRERGIYLRCVSAGREDWRHETGWTFYWKGRLLWVRLDMISFDGQPGGARKSNWKLVQLKEMDDSSTNHLPDDLKPLQSEIVADLREALLAENGGGVYSHIKEYSISLEIGEGV